MPHVVSWRHQSGSLFSFFWGGGDPMRGGITPRKHVGEITQIAPHPALLTLQHVLLLRHNNTHTHNIGRARAVHGAGFDLVLCFHLKWGGQEKPERSQVAQKYRPPPPPPPPNLPKTKSCSKRSQQVFLCAISRARRGENGWRGVLVVLVGRGGGGLGHDKRLPREAINRTDIT